MDKSSAEPLPFETLLKIIDSAVKNALPPEEHDRYDTAELIAYLNGLNLQDTLTTARGEIINNRKWFYWAISRNKILAQARRSPAEVALISSSGDSDDQSDGLERASFKQQEGEINTADPQNILLESVQKQEEQRNLRLMKIAILALMQQESRLNDNERAILVAMYENLKEWLKSDSTTREDDLDQDGDSHADMDMGGGLIVKLINGGWRI